MRKTVKSPTVFQSLIPVAVLIVLIGLNVTLLGDETLAGANQMSLLIASGVTACIAIRNGKTWGDILEGIVRTLTGAIPAILILLMIGVLSGTWMLSGIIPAMIHYGLYVLRPEYFLPATVVISALISLATGSSWSTVATVGVALLGIGRTLGFGDPVIAGAIISGAYFGDKVSPLSDTTNLAAATAGTNLFTHIRYMLYTTLPTIFVTLIIFTILSIGGGKIAADVSVADTQRMITDYYYISPVLFLVPLAAVAMIVFKMPPVPVLFVGSLLGGVMARLPLSALAGVLMVTAWRMNDWEGIRYIFRHKFKSGISQFLITMLATVVFDLTVAILLGVVYSAILYMAKSSHIHVNFSDIDANKLRSVEGKPPILETSGVAYITGALFFGAVDEFNHRMAEMPQYDHIILSMRGMPSVDVSGAQAMLELCEALKSQGKTVACCGMTEAVRTYFDRAGITELLGEESYFWSADQAILDLLDAEIVE